MRFLFFDSFDSSITWYSTKKFLPVATAVVTRNKRFAILSFGASGPCWKNLSFNSGTCQTFVFFILVFRSGGCGHFLFQILQQRLFVYVIRHIQKPFYKFQRITDTTHFIFVFGASRVHNGNRKTPTPTTIAVAIILVRRRWRPSWRTKVVYIGQPMSRHPRVKPFVGTHIEPPDLYPNGFVPIKVVQQITQCVPNNVESLAMPACWSIQQDQRVFLLLVSVVGLLWLWLLQKEGFQCRGR